MINDLTGQRFGFLIAQRCVGKTGHGSCIWLCACDCGNKTTVRGDHLGGGKIKSCGCFRKRKAVELNKKRSIHGMYESPEYKTWASMKFRCYNPNAGGYKYYGERGISVCDEWLHDFAAFYEYIGPRPEKGYSIDRINNDGNYEPGNVRWATAYEQCHNRSNSKEGIRCSEVIQ